MTEIVLPAMGEGIIEATVTKILKKEGEKVEADEAIMELATDKVDSEIVAPFDGTIKKISCKEEEVVAVGSILAYITSEEEEDAGITKNVTLDVQSVVVDEKKEEVQPPIDNPPETNKSGLFLSPLVKSIVKKEKIDIRKLEQISGSGLKGRITKDDILVYLEKRNGSKEKNQRKDILSEKLATSVDGNFEIQEMDRMRSIIADRMIASKQISAHVTSFVEVDMTNIVNWRNRVKDKFIQREGEKITFMPLFIEAITKAIKDFPGVNVSVDGKKVIYKKDINIGMAAALPSGNLIVPVIHKTDNYSLSGLAKKVNDLAGRARKNKLQPNEISGGTFTITNMGTFGNITGTPIINQPQVAILAVGEIKKKPAVIETPDGDLIGIRHMMVMALSYDHRVVDGAMGGMFLKRVSDNLEHFDKKRTL